MSATTSVTRECSAPSLLSANPQGLNRRLAHLISGRARTACAWHRPRQTAWQAFRLRFLVFNLELNEGLDAAYATGHDIDEFDAICDHLIVEHAPTGKIVGTYRLQTGAMASENAGFYSEREFDFSPYKQAGQLRDRTGTCLCAPRSSLVRCPLPAVAWNRSVRYPPWWSVSDRLFFADLARPGAWYSGL